MKKETKHIFGKNYYLLGKRKEDGKKVWLEQGHFDCGWYWGIGYVEIFDKRYTDIEVHTHFDSLFLSGERYCWDLFKDYFEDITISEKEQWQLLENMKTLYIMREYSDLIYRGGAHITTNTVQDKIKNDDEYIRINKKLIPEILENIYKILSDKK